MSTVGTSKYIAEIYNLYLVQNVFVSLKKMSLPGTAEIKDVGDKRMAKWFFKMLTDIITYIYYIVINAELIYLGC